MWLAALIGAVLVVDVLLAVVFIGSNGIDCDPSCSGLQTTTGIAAFGILPLVLTGLILLAIGRFAWTRLRR